MTTSMRTHQQNGINYWNAVPDNIHRYNATQVSYVNGVQYDLLFDATTEGGTDCWIDLTHCLTIPVQNPQGFFTLAQQWRFKDLNVAVVQWNTTRFDDTRPAIGGIAFNSVLMRHELGHDQLLGDHPYTETTYTGLMCGVIGGINGGQSPTCTSQATATSSELATASAQYIARPQAPTLISVGPRTATTVQINFSGASNHDGFMPYRSTSLAEASWVAQTVQSAASTSYTFTGLSPNTTYNFRIAARKAGQAESTSFWIGASTLSAIDLEATNYSPHKPASSSGTTAINEGASSTQFTLSVRNNGTQAAPSSWVKIRFGGNDPPSGGICNIPSIGPGATVSCLTGAVPWTTLFGGPVTVVADYNGLVTESNEGNNTYSWGTIAVKPTAPDNARICTPACDLFGYDDDSSIETGFGIIIQKRSTSCSSGTWSSYAQFLHPPKGGTDDVYFYNFPAGAFRIKVQALGLPAGPHSSTDTSACVFFSS
ncbi:MAG: CARDB domain-containing protein [Dehalococcoidia bacterium]